MGPGIVMLYEGLETGPATQKPRGGEENITLTARTESQNHDNLSNQSPVSYSVQSGTDLGAWES